MEKYSQFYRSHKEKLFGYLMRLTGDFQLSKDTMQESFTRYLEHYGSENQNVSLLYTIARNAVFDSARKNRHDKELDSNSMTDAADPEKQILVREEARRVIAAMQKLEVSERDVLSFVVSTDMTYREIAQLTNTSEANIKVKVHRARGKLRKILSIGEKK